MAGLGVRGPLADLATHTPTMPQPLLGTTQGGDPLGQPVGSVRSCVRADAQARLTLNPQVL